MKNNNDILGGNTTSKTNMVLNTVTETISRHSLISEGDTVLVALSGGADSVCLLDALCKLEEKFGITVAAAHLNHMIRGAEADADEAYAAKLCESLDVRIHTCKVNIPEIAKLQGVSEELAGRNARYDFFAKLSREFNYSKTATAHNRNDRAETVLMRIIRGTGTDGLGSIKYSREDGVVRPLLDVSRADIEEYCCENGLEYCSDSTNLDCDYTRNRIRNRLIPMIKSEFNPNIEECLCSLADNAAADSEFINGYAERLYNRINSPMPHRKPTVIDIKSLKMLSVGIQRRIIRIAAKEVMGAAYKTEKAHIDSVLAITDKNTGAGVDLPDGLCVSVKYGWLDFSKKDAEQSETPEDICYPIDIGDTNSGNAYGIRLEVTDKIISPTKFSMILDYDKLEGRSFSVRNRRFGDRMVFFKDGRTRKLKDYWIDKKLPRSDRAKQLLLCADDEIVAIIGDRVAETYKPNENSARGLVVSYGSDYENR